MRKTLIKLCVGLSLILCNLLVSNQSAKAYETMVAQVILYSTQNDDHSFLVVHNLTSSNIVVGHYTVPANKSVTIGTFGNISQHKGIWYNVEGVYSVSKHVSVAKYISSSQLNTMNNKINSNDTWELLKNCSSFASKVWNSISSTSVSAGAVPTPSTLAASIKSKFSSSYVTNRSIPTKTKNDICYHSSSGVVKCTNPNMDSGSSSGKSVSKVDGKQYLNSSSYFEF